MTKLQRKSCFISDTKDGQENKSGSGQIGVPNRNTGGGGFSHAEVKPAASVRFLFQDKTFVFLNRIMFNRDTDEQKEGDTSRQARMDPPRSSSKNKPTHIHQ